MNLYTRRASIRDAAMDLALVCEHIRLAGGDPATATMDDLIGGTAQAQLDDLVASLMSFDLRNPEVRATLDHGYLRDEDRMLRDPRKIAVTRVQADLWTRRELEESKRAAAIYGL